MIGHLAKDNREPLQNHQDWRFIVPAVFVRASAFRAWAVAEDVVLATEFFQPVGGELLKSEGHRRLV
jgi:hypothetical protein